MKWVSGFLFADFLKIRRLEKPGKKPAKQKQSLQRASNRGSNQNTLRVADFLPGFSELFGAGICVAARTAEEVHAQRGCAETLFKLAVDSDLPEQVDNRTKGACLKGIVNALEAS